MRSRANARAAALMDKFMGRSDFHSHIGVGRVQTAEPVLTLNTPPPPPIKSLIAPQTDSPGSARSLFLRGSIICLDKPFLRSEITHLVPGYVSSPTITPHPQPPLEYERHVTTGDLCARFVSSVF